MGTEITIEKGIPMPRRTRGGPIDLYPWAKMDIGDSFFVANAKSFNTKIAARKYNRQFATRKVVEQGQSGIRVWRTA